MHSPALLALLLALATAWTSLSLVQMGAPLANVERLPPGPTARL